MINILNYIDYGNFLEKFFSRPSMPIGIVKVNWKIIYISTLLLEYNFSYFWILM